jgi:putative transposase
MIKLDSKIIKYFKGYNNDELIMTCLYFKFRYSLSYRDIEELSGIRGFAIYHSNIQRWVEKFTPLLNKRFRSRKRAVSSSWGMDETYIKVKGKWVYLYRAVDKYGLTIDFCLRAKRDAVTAKAFFRRAIKQHGKPAKVGVDKSGSNKCALDSINDNYPEGEKIEIRQNKYLNNVVEQDHRFIKRRTKPALGYKSFSGAKQTITGIEIAHMIKKGQLKNSNQNNKSVFNQFLSLVA